MKQAIKHPTLKKKADMGLILIMGVDVKLMIIILINITKTIIAIIKTCISARTKDILSTSININHRPRNT